LVPTAQRLYSNKHSAFWLARTLPVLVFIVALAMLLAIAAYVQLQSARESQARQWATHTLLVQQAAVELEADLLQMETEHRAFLLTGAPNFLDARQRYWGTASRALADLRGLTRDNAGQQARLSNIGRLFYARVARMQAMTELAQRQGIDAARADFNPAGATSIVPLREAIDQLGRVEAALYKVRSGDAARQAAQLRSLLLLGPVIGIVLLAIGLYALLRQLRRSELIGSELESANAQAQNALRLLDATYDGVFIYEADTLRLIYVNQGAVDQTGYSRSELLGMSALDIKRQFDDAGLRQRLAPLLGGEATVLSFETLHRRKDGVDVPVEVSARYAALADGVPSVVTAARDISARKQAEDERDRFFNLSLDMLCVASADGYFKRLSPAFTTTLGWSIEEMLGRPFIDFVHPDDHQATLAEVERQVVAGEPVLNFENRFQHKDGSYRVLSWKSAPQPDGRMYATARDVTARKQAEQSVIDLNGELLDRQTALEAANKELESFSYSISHDLRAPLRHIDGFARMLLEDTQGQLEAEPQRYLQTIIDSTRRMGMLIDDLLAFSRLGRKPLAMQMVNMDDLVNSAVGEVRAGNAGRHGDVQIEVTPLPPVGGDKALLRQVWTNLISNAVKYSQPRGDQARIVVAGERKGDLMHYWIQDNGVGFDMRYADKLFGVFQRLHPQEDFEGTGVGLAIVQRIINRHGGQVSATADVDRGACFSFDLPISEVAS
jgi:PAS domain S-box-containing protein